MWWTSVSDQPYQAGPGPGPRPAGRYGEAGGPAAAALGGQEQGQGAAAPARWIEPQVGEGGHGDGGDAAGGSRAIVAPAATVVVKQFVAYGGPDCQHAV